MHQYIALFHVHMKLVYSLFTSAIVPYTHSQLVFSVYAGAIVTYSRYVPHFLTSIRFLKVG